MPQNKGFSKEEAARLQQQMVDSGIDMPVDGIWGPKSEAGYELYQQNANPSMDEKPVITPELEKLSTATPEVSERPLTAEEKLLKGFYSVTEKAPTIDQAKIDRLKRMGRINSLAKGTKVLADIAGTALGANVRRRQPDSTAPALFQAYQNMLDKYKDQTDNYNLRDFQTKRQNAQVAIQRKDKETAEQFANRKQAAIEKNNEIKARLDNSKFLAGLKQKQEAMDNTKAYQRGRLGVEGEKLKLAKEKQDATKDKPFDPVQVTDKFGKSIKLDQGQWDNLYQNALRDKEFTDGNMKAEISKYKELPDGGVKQIARAYYDYKRNQEYQANEKAALEKHRQELQPKAQFNPDKAKKFKGVPTGGF